MENIVFIGGIHGSGKETICKLLASKSELIHITASEVINWDTKSKNVKSIENTQEKLIKGLAELINKNEQYLLDGHFCLFNKNGNVEKVPFNTFKRIKPRIIIVVVDNVTLIKERLENRDSINYSINTLIEMQNTEVEYAKLIAQKLEIPYIEHSNEKPDYLLKKII